MTNKEYDEYKQIAMKICSNDERTEDLLHDILIQLSTNQKFKTLNQKERKYFFIKSLSNQFYSNNSYFYRQFKKFKYEEFNNNLNDSVDDEYIDKPSFDWIREQLNIELQKDPKFWYDKGIFELYMEHQKLETLHRKTMIPRYSLRSTINSVKLLLKQKWEKYG